MKASLTGGSPGRPVGPSSPGADDPSTDEGTDRPRIFILSNSRLLREGVVFALSGQSSVQVVGAADLSAAPDEIAGHCPDALLLDIALPGGLAISRSIRQLMPMAKIVALGVSEIEQVVMACAKAGVSGFVPPNGSVKDVIAAVHSAVRGELVCSPRTAGMLLSGVSALTEPAPPRDDDRVEADALTQRENEIAGLMADGLSNKQIAQRLGIRGATVKNHVHSILSKLRLSRRGEVAARLGRTALPPHRRHMFLGASPGLGLDQTI